MSAKTGKRPLRSLTAHEKLEAIRRVHDGESKASVARDIGVPESTLRGWCKNEDKISYLSRQSSPDTDESLEHPGQNKKPKIDDTLNQPFNLSLKSSGGSFTETNQDYSKNGVVDLKVPVSVAAKETPKSSTSLIERDRNRAELARLSVELGLNRPEMFLPTLNGAATNVADLSTNIGLLTQWNNLLVQNQQQQKVQQQQVPKKVTAPADTSTSVLSSNLLTTVDQDKSKILPKDKPSVNDSVWYWLKTQQTMLGLNQTPTTSVSSVHSTNGTPNVSTPVVTTTANSNLSHGSISPDQSSWFWRWYKQFAYSQIGQPHCAVPENKPILYQQLTKDVPQREHVSPSISPVSSQQIPDQQNAENLSMRDEKLKSPEKAHSKARSVLDNLLFNNNNNVTSNRRDDKEDEMILSQSEAVEHGEKFLKWLEACSDPSVTAMQIMQFRTLLNNVKSGADRKNGELQNKTKVKRK